ncbi:MAG: putative PEP-binding protein [Elainellaceae cyanobacterium]
MAPFYALCDRRVENSQLVGGKAARLASLLRQGYPGVPGFVAAAPLWRQFLDSIDLAASETGSSKDIISAARQLNPGDSHQLQAVAPRLQAAVHAQPLPQSWRSPLAEQVAALQASTLILRPSLVLPEAVPLPEGLLHSQIVSADVTSVVQGLKSMWAQPLQATSLFYWHHMALDLGRVGLAVVIQPLLPATASGTLTISGDRLTLQSVRGLGHALVLGEAVPEYYSLDLSNGQVRERAAQQTHAYRLVGRSRPDTNAKLKGDPSGSKPSQPTAAPLGLLGDTPPSLDYEQCPGLPSVLSPNRRRQLVRLGQSFAGQSFAGQSFAGQSFTGQPELKLEWIICGDDSETIYITQLTPQAIIPQASGAAAQPRIIHSSGQPATAPAAPLTGLGVSPGQVRGRVYRVSSPNDWIPPDAILLAVDMTPDWISLIQRATGVVTEQGGMTSHAAIVTRALGIPAVVGMSNATQLLQDGDVIFLDGSSGSVVRFPSASCQVHLEPEEASEHRRVLLDLARRSPIKPEVSDSAEYRIRPVGSFCSLSPSRAESRTKLMLTLSHVDQLYRAINTPIDGIGLLRSELLLLPLLGQRHPLHWITSGDQAQLMARIAAQVSQLAAAVFPDPVFYRSLNLCSDEFSHLDGAPQLHERNPVLGEHGTYSYSHNPKLFETELAALRQVQQAGYSNLRLVLPFVRSVEEVTYAQQRVQKAQLTQVESFQLWIMAEVPSVLLLLPEYVQAGVQGIAIGSNDLAQLLFAADRNQPAISRRFHAHPALMRAIRQLVEQAKQLGIASSICGDLPSQSPETVADLVEWGVGAISVPPGAAAAVRQAIAAAEASSVDSQASASRSQFLN